MTDDLVCRSLPVTGDAKQFYARQFGTCIPLATWESYQDTDLGALEMVSEFLAAHPPFLTAAYYDSSVVPPSRKVEPLVVHDTHWVEHVASLTGPNHVCFVSDWNLLEKDLHRVLGPGYKGEVIRRGSNEALPVLLEWTPELLLPDVSRRLGFGKVWNHGTWAYVVPSEARHLLRKWAQTSSATEEVVPEFFHVLKLMFWVKYDLDGIWVMSHKMSSDGVRSALQKSV